MNDQNRLAPAASARGPVPDLRGYRPAPDLLRDRVIVVSGAGDGIGRALAAACAGHGATVVLLGRAVAKLEALCDRIEGAGHPPAAIYPIDLAGASPQDYQQLGQILETTYGTLHGLVHNAAQLGPLSPLASYDVKAWHRVMQVNLNAPFLLTRACLGLLQRADDASVVFASDRVGRVGRAYWGAYGISKHGLEGMMQVLADELESTTSIRVNSLAPEPVRTALRARAFPGENPHRLPAPEAVVGSYLFLLGPDSKGVTGHALDAPAQP